MAGRIDVRSVREPGGSASVLVGRSHELAALTWVLARPPAVAVVEGEAGIGKTRLVTELQAGPAAAGRRFVVGGCCRIRDPFPLGPVVEAVRGLGKALAAAPLSPVAGALQPLLPEIAVHLPPPLAPLADRAAERHRVFRALAEVLGSVGPAVLVLEDMHWADAQTVDFLSYLLGGQPRQLSVLLTFRGEEVAAGVRALASKLPAPVRRVQVQLPPLDASQTGALAAGVLGLERVSEEFAGYLCERASGLPFAVEELLALLQARGSLMQHGGRWSRWTLDELDVPAGVRNHVLERVDRLGRDARSVAEAAAVLQVPVSVPVLVATGRLSRPRARRGMEQALESGVLTERESQVGLRHPLAAQAVYEAIPGHRRQELHERAAAAFGGLDPVPLGQVAHHLRHAGRLADWVDAAERAAQRATELGNEDEAARLLTAPLRHAPLGPERRGRLAVRLGRIALETSGAAEITGLIGEVLEQPLPRSVRGELRFRFAALRELGGADPGQVRALLAEAAGELDDQPDLKAWAMIAVGCIPVLGEDPAERRARLDLALEILPTVQDPGLEVLLCGKAAMVLTSLGDSRWRPLVERILELTGGVPRQQDETRAYWSVGMEACYVGHHEIAGRLLGASLAGAVACESRHLELRARSTMALFDYCRGAWDGLAERAETLIDSPANDFPGRIEAQVAAGCLALAQGALDVASGRLMDAIERAERRGGFDLLPIPASALVRLALARGRVGDAVASARRVVETVESIGLWGPMVRVLPAVAEALAAAGQVREVRALVNRCARRLRGLDAPLAAAALAHARGFLAAAGDRWSTAAGQFRAAAEHYERLGCPYEAAQAREQAASALLAAGGQEAPGEAALRAVLATYQELGATWDAARAAQAARERGVSLPSRHRGGRRGYGSDLSPRQREVAELAATGRTNKQIGAELFLSPSTVNLHLVAAMKKLGVHSRTALAHLLAGRRPVSGEQKQTI
ncbi:MAG: AAA family ATPase [Micromonosporaceae bacterium]|nr:AAA family ATPase [Micromonosporaceae bacterium]